MELAHISGADILGFNDLATKTVEVPEWDCVLTIRELSLEHGLQMFQMAKGFTEETFTIESDDVAHIVAWGVIDPASGERLFSDEDIPRLKQKNKKPMMLLYKEIAKLSNETASKN